MSRHRPLPDDMHDWSPAQAQAVANMLRIHRQLVRVTACRPPMGDKEVKRRLAKAGTSLHDLAKKFMVHRCVPGRIISGVYDAPDSDFAWALRREVAGQIGLPFEEVWGFQDIGAGIDFRREIASIVEWSKKMEEEFPEFRNRVGGTTEA